MLTAPHHQSFKLVGSSAGLMTLCPELDLICGLGVENPGLNCSMDVYQQHGVLIYMKLQEMICMLQIEEKANFE